MVFFFNGSRSYLKIMKILKHFSVQINGFLKRMTNVRVRFTESVCSVALPCVRFHIFHNRLIVVHNRICVGTSSNLQQRNQYIKYKVSDAAKQLH